MKRLAAIILLICLLAGEKAWAGEASAAFRAGDRWAAVGDSITHSGSYHAWVQLFYLTRFPGRQLEVLNLGIAGDTAAGGVRRLAWDILPAKGTVATVMFGMNDVNRALYAANAKGDDLPEKRRAALETYQANLTTLVASLRTAGTRVILMTPSPFDQTAELPAAKFTGVNDALAEAAAMVRRLADEKGLAVIDLHEPMTRLNRKLQEGSPAFTLTSADRIHPAAPGHLVMAYFLLKAQGMPMEVSRLSIDSATLKAGESRNGVVSNLLRSEGDLSFTWTAQALPFPNDASFGDAMTWVPFAAELNQEVFRVTALPEATYVLRIDAIEVGRYSARELERGINLAENSLTPQYRQAVEVLRLLQQQRLHVMETARNIALVEHQCAPANEQPFTPESVRPYYASRLAQLIESQPPTSNLLRIYKLYPEIKPRTTEDRALAQRLAEDARRAAQPKPRAYELIRVR